MNYEKVGEGQYGRVFKPSLKCDEDIDTYANKVSKVMETKDANDELKEYEKINIEGLNKYAIINPIKCNPKINKEFKSIVKKCKYLKNIHGNYSMLIYEDGGKNLNEFLSFYNFNELKKRENLKKIIINFLISLITLIDGLNFFKTNNILHRDIKLDNIVYNFNTREIKYIDFGLMIEKNEAINNSFNNEKYKFTLIDYEPFPPEFRCTTNVEYHSGRCILYRNKEKKMNYNKFLNLAMDSFDLYSLSIVFSRIAVIIEDELLDLFDDEQFSNFLETFTMKLMHLSLEYIKEDFFERKKDIDLFKEEYISILEESFGNIVVSETQPDSPPPPPPQLDYPIKETLISSGKKKYSLLGKLMSKIPTRRLGISKVNVGGKSKKKMKSRKNNRLKRRKSKKKKVKKY